MWAPLFAAGLAGAGYVLGTVLHEVSHVATVLGTGGELKNVEWRQTVVHYDPSSEWADRLIKATPAALTPVLAGTVLFSVETLFGAVFALGLLGGFIPRDPTEWLSLTQL